MAVGGGKVILTLYLWKIKHGLRDLPRAVHESLEELKVTYTLSQALVYVRISWVRQIACNPGTSDEQQSVAFH